MNSRWHARQKVEDIQTVRQRLEDVEVKPVSLNVLTGLGLFYQGKVSDFLVCVRKINNWQGSQVSGLRNFAMSIICFCQFMGDFQARLSSVDYTGRNS